MMSVQLVLTMFLVKGGVPKGEGAVADPLYLCGYGAHPCHVLWVRGGDLYSSDLRAKLVCARYFHKEFKSYRC